jgi:hypothetical protein
MIPKNYTRGLFIFMALPVNQQLLVSIPINETLILKEKKLPGALGYAGQFDQ